MLTPPTGTPEIKFLQQQQQQRWVYKAIAYTIPGLCHVWDGQAVCYVLFFWGRLHLGAALNRHICLSSWWTWCGKHSPR